MKWLFLLFPTFCFAIIAPPEALSPLTVSIQTPNPGYSIQIERVDRGEKQMYVLVSVISPPPGQMNAAVISEAADTVHISGPVTGPQIYILNRHWGWGDEPTVKSSADYLKAIGETQPVPFQRDNFRTEITGRKPEFTWLAVSGATWYQIWVNRDGSTYHGEWVNGSTSWTPSEEWKGGWYEWWVRGWGPSLGMTAWSSGSNFRIPVRTPSSLTQLSPQGPQEEYALTYRWEKDEAATWYRLWVGGEDAGIWHDKWFESSGMGEGSAYPGSTRPANASPAPSSPTGTVDSRPRFEWEGGQHSWWLRAWGPDGYGPWSGPMTFTVPYANGTWVRLYVNSGNTNVLDQWTQSGSYPSSISTGSYNWWMGVYDPGSGQTRWSDRVDFRVE